MSDQAQQFQHRWEFRRTENDFDSSDDDHSRPGSASEPKATKHKLVTCLFPEENPQQTLVSPTSLPLEENIDPSTIQEPNRKPKHPVNTRERKAKSRRTKKTTSNPKPSDAVLTDLRGYMESLVEGIKTTREDLLSWMSNEMKSSSKDDTIPAKPSVTRKGQRQDAKRSKTLRNNPNKGKRRSGTITQNPEDGASGRRSPQINEEVAVPPKKGENVVIDTKPVEKNVKKKGKTSRQSTKKRKIDGTVAVEQTDKTTTAAAADNCLTLPTVLPQKQVINSEIDLLEDGNGRDSVKSNALNSGVDFISHHLNFDPRAQQQDGTFAQNDLRNVSGYEQITCPMLSNLNGNGLPFSLVPQGSNGGFGMPNISSQFGLQYLSQSNGMSGMYREPVRFSTGNHGYMENYGGLNQPLKFNAQQGGAMSLQCPDIRRGSFNQSNISSQ